MAFDPPMGSEGVFGPNVRATDLAPYMGPGNPPVYVSSVTYGRRFFLLIESTSSVTEMKASIQASYDAALVSGSLDASAIYVKNLQVGQTAQDVADSRAAHASLGIPAQTGTVTTMPENAPIGVAANAPMGAAASIGSNYQQVPAGSQQTGFQPPMTMDGA